MKINLATKITIVRVLLIVVLLSILLFPYESLGFKVSTQLFGYTFYTPHLWAFIVFVIASLSDMLDGMIARKTNTITTLGKFLDPIADKLLVNSILVYLVFSGNIYVLWVIIMISRDIMVDALRMICVEKNIVIAANKYGKLKTIFQMVTISLLLLFSVPGVINSSIILHSLVIATTCISVFSGIIYFMENIEVFNTEE